MVQHIGELAAFGTSVSWTIAALVMEQGVKRVGVMAVNTFKVAFGSVYLALLALALNGSLFPSGMSPMAWWLLAGSALVGFVLGDYFLLNAYTLIGSRLSMLLMSLTVPLTAIGALFLFSEALKPWSVAGIALCVAGISLTVYSGRAGSNAASAQDSQKGNQPDVPLPNAAASRYRKGVVFGVASALCMAVATLMTKRGANGVDSISATQVRIFCAFAGFLLFALVTRKTGELGNALRSRKGLLLIAIGGIFGPFIGVGCLLFALQHAEAGIVSTLSSFTPVLIIPPSIALFGRRVGPFEIIGAIVAVGGLALLFI